MLSMQEGAGYSRITITTSRAGQRCDTIGIGCLAGDDNMPPPHRQESLKARPLLARCQPASHRAGERVGGFQQQQLEASVLCPPCDTHETATPSIIAATHYRNTAHVRVLTACPSRSISPAVQPHASSSAHTPPHYTATQTSKRLTASPQPAGTSPSADQWLSPSHQPATAYGNVP
jgi:hypothetical protein